jgi:hypothetical protein
MRYRKRIRLFPGVTLNLSKTGISTTVGVPGASVNFNRNGTFLNTGLPGTGLYDRKRIGGQRRPSSSTGIPTSNTGFGSFNRSHSTGMDEKPITENLEKITTEGLQELRNTLLECYNEKLELEKAVNDARKDLWKSKNLLLYSKILLIGFFIKWFKQNMENKQEYLEDLEKQLEACFVAIDIQTDGLIEQKFLTLQECYKNLITCEKVWDITSSYSLDPITTRWSASEQVVRQQVKFGFGNLEMIKMGFDALHFENANGGDLYIYPAFVAVVNSNKSFALIDLKEIDIDYSTKEILERQGVPTDARVVGSTWDKVNKDGSPDRRFKDNYQIPICLYGKIEIKSTTGLNEAYFFSNLEKAERFAESFKGYQEEV